MTITGTCKKCGNPYFGNDVTISYSGAICRCPEPDIVLNETVVTNNTNHKEMHKRFDERFGHLTFGKFDSDRWETQDIENFIESELERERERIVKYIEGEKKRLLKADKDSAERDNKELELMERQGKTIQEIAERENQQDNYQSGFNYGGYLALQLIEDYIKGDI